MSVLVYNYVCVYVIHVSTSINEFTRQLPIIKQKKKQKISRKKFHRKHEWWNPLYPSSLFANHANISQYTREQQQGNFFTYFNT